MTRPFWLVLGVSALLLGAWSLVVPVFEGPDEPAHWAYARYLHDHLRLPVYTPQFQEANSPPLYYALVAPVARPSELPRSRVYYRPDAGSILAEPPRHFGNRSGDLLRFWPVRAARVVSILLSLAAVIVTAWVARDATGRTATAWLAAGLVGLLPQFTFRGMNVSNDAAVTAAGALATLALLRVARRPSRGAVVAAGLATALAALSKATALLLLPAAACAALIAPGAPPRRALRAAGVCVAALAALAPWLIRNQVLYGDVVAQGVMRRAVPWLLDEKSLASAYFYTRFPRVLAESLAGRFGWMNVPMPAWAYGALAALAIAAAAGLVVCIARRGCDRITVGLLSLVVLCIFAAVVHINLMFTQPQGRYLFPALAAMATLTAIGLESLPGWRPAAGAGVLVGLGVLNVSMLVGVVWPAYWPAPRLDRPFYDGAVSEVTATLTRFRTTAASGRRGHPLAWTCDTRRATLRGAWSGGEILHRLDWAGEPGLADFDGDGVPDVCAFGNDGTWRIRNGRSQQPSAVQWGAPGDIAVPGNYMGDARDEVAVWRPSTGAWYVTDPARGATATDTWGRQGDVPVPFDADGDGWLELTVWRPATGTFYVKPLGRSPLPPVHWGTSGDVPVPGNYAGDARGDFAVYRPADGRWHVLDAGTGPTRSTWWGVAEDVPAPVDTDGDGRLEYAVWRPRTATWYILAADGASSLTLASGPPGTRPGGR